MFKQMALSAVSSVITSSAVLVAWNVNVCVNIPVLVPVLPKVPEVPPIDHDTVSRTLSTTKVMTYHSPTVGEKLSSCNVPSA